MIDDHQAVLFGGFQSDGQLKWTNDTYILDLKIMVSTCIKTLLLYYTRKVQSLLIFQTTLVSLHVLNSMREISGIYHLQILHGTC